MRQISPSHAPADALFALAGRHVYMVGIGGCGMSGLARMLRARGAIVAGSDSSPGETTALLAEEGVPVCFEQAEGRVPEPCDLVIASAAVRPEHPELLAAQRRGVEIITYAEALGRCMAGRTGVALAGTHGKSTTTAMLGAALTDAGLDPTVIVGATCPQLARGCLAPAGRSVGFRLGAETIPAGPLAGRPGLLLAEACEFNRSFHHLRPTVASISSVEADHLDVYGSLDAVVQAFAEFARLLPPADQGGLLLIADEGAHRRQVAAGLRCRVETIGFSPAADWVVWLDTPTRRVTLTRRGAEVASWRASLPGAHNAMNAATACALAVSLGADGARVAESLESFRGVDRRTQFLGERPVPGGAVRVYDDYGHHPTEIAATLDAVRQGWPGRRLVLVFQPHRYTRTRDLIDDFAEVLCSADVLLVGEVYAAGEMPITGADGRAVCRAVRSRGKVEPVFVERIEQLAGALAGLLEPGDVILTMGAGSIGAVAHELPAQLAEGAP